MTALVMMAIIIFGVAGYRTLPVSDLPNIDYPTMQVQANLPGASPETMAASVATVLERQFSTMPGLDSMTSTSVRGRTNVTLQFTLDRNIDAASQDVQNRDLGSGPAAARRHAGAAPAAEGEPGGPGHHVHGPEFRHDLAARAG